MSERPTPETDAADGKPTWQADIVEVGWVQSDFARRLERKRDAERALADQLAEGLRKMVLYSEALILRIQDRSDINFKTLNECIDLFNEWKEARND